MVWQVPTPPPGSPTLNINMHVHILYTVHKNKRKYFDPHLRWDNGHRELDWLRDGWLTDPWIKYPCLNFSTQRHLHIGVVGVRQGAGPTDRHAAARALGSVRLPLAPDIRLFNIIGYIIISYYYNIIILLSYDLLSLLWLSLTRFWYLQKVCGACKRTSNRTVWFTTDPFLTFLDSLLALYLDSDHRSGPGHLFRFASLWDGARDFTFFGWKIHINHHQSSSTANGQNFDTNLRCC